MDQWVDEIPDGRVVLFEGGVDASKTVLARRFAHAAAASNRAVCFVSSLEGNANGSNGSQAKLIQHQTAADFAKLPPVPAKADLVIDCLSPLLLGEEPAAIAPWLQRIRRDARRTGRIVALTVDRDVSSPAMNALVAHYCDGVIQFFTRDDAEGVVSYLRVPRWLNGQMLSRNVYYSLEGSDLLIDTRKRVN